MRTTKNNAISGARPERARASGNTQQGLVDDRVGASPLGQRGDRLLTAHGPAGEDRGHGRLRIRVGKGIGLDAATVIEWALHVVAPPAVAVAGRGVTG